MTGDGCQFLLPAARGVQQLVEAVECERVEVPCGGQLPERTDRFTDALIEASAVGGQRGLPVSERLSGVFQSRGCGGCAIG